MGAKEQKPPGTISRCDAQKETQVGGEINMRGSELGKLRWGTWGSVSGDVYKMLHLHIGGSGQSSAWRLAGSG